MSQLKDLTPAQRAIVRARVNLIMDHPFFGSLVMKMQIIPGEQMGVTTAATDGTHLFYCESYISSLTEHEVRAVLAHEVMHCALLHPFRIGEKDRMKANIAMDYAINPILVDSGFTLPAGVLLDNKYRNMTWERIYSLLPDSPSGGKPMKGAGKDQGQGQQGQGQAGKGQSGQDKAGGGSWANMGGVMQPPPPKPKDQGQADQGKGTAMQPGTSSTDYEPMTETDWEIAASQAEKVSAGKVPGVIADQIRVARVAKPDSWAIIRRFVDANFPSDYSWSHPNRRALSMGMFLPGVKKENVGELVVAADTSGSISNEMLNHFAAHMAVIINDYRPSKVTVMYADTRVYRTEEFEYGEEFRMETKMGRGGTNFGPVFAKVEELGLEPRALIYLTDLEPGDNPPEPGYPVLWAVPDTCYKQSWEWGEVVPVEMSKG